MRTADEQRGGGWGSQGVCQKSAKVERSHRGGMMEQMTKARMREGDGWRGKTLLLYCVAAPGHCPVPPQHSTSSPFVSIVP